MRISIKAPLDNAMYDTVDQFLEDADRWLWSNVALEIDVGSATGLFLRRLATQSPSRNFIGVEIDRIACQMAEKEILRYGLKNAGIVNTSAFQFFRGLPNQCVDTMHVYFPTPGGSGLTKNRQLVTLDLVNEMHRVLRNFGLVRLVTDHKEYFDTMLSYLEMDLWWPVEWIAPKAEQPTGYLVGTPKEHHYRPRTAIYHHQLYAIHRLRKIG